MIGDDKSMKGGAEVATKWFANQQQGMATHSTSFWASLVTGREGGREET